MKLYLASSWRNPYQPEVLRRLREAGHEVYDFRNPAPGDNGFSWSEIYPEWESWSSGEFIEGLHHPAAERGYAFDFEAMETSDGCVLLLPSGRSAHIEAGWFAGAGRYLAILMMGDNEPELMYKMADDIFVNVEDLIHRLRNDV